jgi:hypothetical protein
VEILELRRVMVEWSMIVSKFHFTLLLYLVSMRYCPHNGLSLHSWIHLNVRIATERTALRLQIYPTKHRIQNTEHTTLLDHDTKTRTIPLSRSHAVFLSPQRAIPN